MSDILLGEPLNYRIIFFFFFYHDYIKGETNVYGYVFINIGKKY